ncbi:MAG: universal stress protein [Hyphomicrobium sp.]|uniref:universal stress protein n=1 Tax=Hyphomicrobium sp. TaxID=82 RepID=UPI001323407F|nr:universal stress protein [Hyphomicrobium sp.]KAB2939589.1 MAG: universal stress protein [Hyphomicrobium sp.]MBZ0208322.1 universal stress protein [Hyphomicrobium sp.]
MAMLKILTPVDGSPASLRAVDFALEMLSKNPGGSLVLLNVQNVGSVDPFGIAAMAPPDWFQDAASRASEEALKSALSKCKGVNIAFKPLVRAGQVAKAIAEVAREEGVGQIVMGTRGLGGVQGLLLGSVATQMIHLAEVPVTLIK